jgi:hypothetical protein
LIRDLPPPKQLQRIELCKLKVDESVKYTNCVSCRLRNRYTLRSSSSINVLQGNFLVGIYARFMPSSAAVCYMSSRRTNIRLNVYNASKEGVELPTFLKCVGFYHSGVEINGIEYSFAGVTGVYECRKGDYGPVVESVDLGNSYVSSPDIPKLISDMRAHFRGDTYHVILHNCNHFSDALVRACMNNLSGIPGWVNRAARIASCCRCFFQSSMTEEQRPLVNPTFTGQGISLSNNSRGQFHRLTREEEREIRINHLSKNVNQSIDE